MSNITEKGILPIGIEHEGAVHREFALRPLKVKDSFSLKESAYAEKAVGNGEYMGLCFYAARLEKLGDIPKEAITPELLMDLYDDDMAAIVSADEALKKRLHPSNPSSNPTES